MKGTRLPSLLAISMWAMFAAACASSWEPAASCALTLTSARDRVALEDVNAIRVRALRGVVRPEDGQTWSGDVKAVVEFCGPTGSTRYRRLLLPRDGRFDLQGAAEGEYWYRASAPGRITIYGKAIVSHDAAAGTMIEIDLPLHL